MIRVLFLLLASTIAARADGAPTVAEIQQAYDAEAGRGDGLHVPGLRIVGALCDPLGDQFSCQVGFSQPGEERVYLDIAAVTREGERWRLRSGLCRRSL